jgi:hypothetical protein
LILWLMVCWLILCHLLYLLCGRVIQFIQFVKGKCWPSRVLEKMYSWTHTCLQKFWISSSGVIQPLSPLAKLLVIVLW